MVDLKNKAADIVEQPTFLWPPIFLSVHLYDRLFSWTSNFITVHFYKIIEFARITLAEQIFLVNFDALPQSSFQVYSCLIYLFVNNYFCVRNEHIRTVRCHDYLFIISVPF